MNSASRAGFVAGVRDYIARTVRHPVGFIGINLTTLAGVMIVVFLGLDLTGRGSNPYIGIVTFFLLPAILVLGLVMMPIGRWLELRRARSAGLHGEAFPVYDLNHPRIRSRLVFIAVMTLVNLCIVMVVSYRGVEHMESVEFCGTTCHQIMEPEFVAHGNSPHQRVPCVDCHIGAGVGSFVQAKLNGASQMLHTTLNDYERPVPTPVHTLRPARNTCEECHWPEKHVGDRVTVKTHYQDDEANTALKTVLLLKVGGGGSEPHSGNGIHWHIANEVEYRSDPSRESIYWVQATRRNGEVREFVRSDLAELPDSIMALPTRRMDCVDCHNRPTHIYRLPGDALDRAMSLGTLPSDLPYLHREGLAALTVEYPDREAAARAIEEHLRGFYRENYPAIVTERTADLDRAVTGVQKAYHDNVFPAMKVGWGTYPDHIGHQNFPGCFRCHDEDHVTKDGETISQDCSTCHSLLAIEEENPEILTTLFPDQ